MIYVKSASFFIGLISSFIAYLVVVTCGNAFRAWAAKRMGDDTAAMHGFLTLNPLVHIHSMSVVIFFVLYYMGVFFGWGAHIPIDPRNISGKMRLAFAYLSGSIAQFSLALVGIISLIVLFDAQIIPLTQYMVLSRNMSHLYLAHMYPEASSLVIAIGFVLISFIYLATLLGVFSLIIDGCQLVTFLSSPGNFEVGTFLYPLYSVRSLMIPTLIMFFFSEGLRYMATTLIVFMGYVVVYIVGLV